MHSGQNNQNPKKKKVSLSLSLSLSFSGPDFPATVLRVSAPVIKQFSLPSGGVLPPCAGWCGTVCSLFHKRGLRGCVVNSLLSSSSSGQTWSRVRGVRRPEGKRGGGNHGGGGVACNVIPVNHTYINICTIKSILVNNTAEDANTNKQTHSKTKTFVLVHFDMQAPGPNPVDPQTKLKSYKRKEKNIKGRDKGFFFVFFCKQPFALFRLGKEAGKVNNILSSLIFFLFVLIMWLHC